MNFKYLQVYIFIYTFIYVLYTYITYIYIYKDLHFWGYPKIQGGGVLVVKAQKGYPYPTLKSVHGFFSYLALFHA